MERHVQFAHPVTMEAAIDCAVEYEAFTNSQSSTRKPKNDYVVRAVHREDRRRKHGNEVEKSDKSKNADITEFVKTFSKCMEKVTEKLVKLINQLNIKIKIKILTRQDLGNL